MKKQPLVSLLINNYNYDMFLSEAIESSLNQTYSNIEVIVVDDGSTDSSAKIINSYQDKVIPVLKANGGQASAFNAGFAIAKGEIIIFLDSDDVLLPDIVEKTVLAFQENKDAVKVQYRLQVIDVNSQPTGEIVPLSSCKMPNGDLKPQIFKFGSYTWPPTSGNAFKASMLRQLLPMPEDVYRISADRYLNNLSVMFGAVVSLDEIGGFYRVHGKNNFRTSKINVNKLRRQLIGAARVHAKKRELARTLYSLDISYVESRDLLHVMNRIIVLKLDRQNYPLTDSLLNLCWQGLIVSLVYCDYHWSRKLVLASWFVLMFLLPNSMAENITNQIFYPNTRGGFTRKLLATMKKFA
ncbi:glycosyltransferase [Scytonema sp. UIC 10036]|uniref:glycosyltransferase n=1 Tax=Scytonema sp. UIC 10036 TaxID=2304196 RepID=UPI0012DAB621|nr:glycosyltransferase [Scytonema sp. UIC 10036]